MKTITEVRNRLRLEIQHWFNKQASAWDNYYLYYMPSSLESDSGLLIAKDTPANGNYKLVTGQSLFKGRTKEQNFYYFSELLNKLPLLDITK